MSNIRKQIVRGLRDDHDKLSRMVTELFTGEEGPCSEEVERIEELVYAFNKNLDEVYTTIA